MATGKPTPDPSSKWEDTLASVAFTRRQAPDGRPPKGVFEPTAPPKGRTYGYPSGVVPAHTQFSAAVLGGQNRKPRRTGRSPTLNLLRPAPKTPLRPPITTEAPEERGATSQEELCFARP